MTVLLGMFALWLLVPVSASASTTTGVLEKWSGKASSTKFWVSTYNTSGTKTTRTYKGNSSTVYRIQTSSGSTKTVTRTRFFKFIRNTSDTCSVRWAWRERSDGTRYRYVKRITGLLVNTEG
jgi:hypothetical protein